MVMQSLLQSVVRGTGVGDPLPVEGFARFVPYQHCLLTDPHHRPILSQQTVLLPERLAAPRLEALVGDQDPLTVVWVKALGPQLLGLPLLGGVTEHLLYLRACVERGLRVVYRVYVGNGGYLLYQGTVVFLRVPNLLLCPLALTYVLDLRDEVQWFVFCFGHHRDAKEDPHHVASLWK